MSEGDKAAGAKFNFSPPYRINIKNGRKFPSHHNLVNMAL